jgi:hypothetical protein
MAKNKFGIPNDILSRIKSRDRACVYCREKLIYPWVATNRRRCATIEHLNFDPPFYWREGLQANDIVMCCGSCNSSRGVKTLTEWFRASYCIDRNINARTVAAPVRSYLRRKKNHNRNQRSLRGAV